MKKVIKEIPTVLLGLLVIVTAPIWFPAMFAMAAIHAIWLSLVECGEGTKDFFRN